MYVGGSQTTGYRKVNFGYGNRYDFTTANVKHKGDYSYDFDKLGSFKNTIENYKIRSNKKADSFGSPYSKYEKVMVNQRGAYTHYYGKGNNNLNGVGIEELKTAEMHCRKSCQRVPIRTANRGLLAPSTKEIKSAIVGPGTYAIGT